MSTDVTETRVGTTGPRVDTDETGIDVTSPKKKKAKKAKSGKSDAPAKDSAGDKKLSRQDAEPVKPSVREQLTANLNPRRHPVIVGLAVMCLVALVAATVFAVLFDHRSQDLTTARQLAADKESAERVAGDYAVGAASFDYNNLDQWSAALKKGTAPELTSRFDVAVKTLTPLIQEVQWTQTAKLIAAKTVDIHADRQFVVQVFVSTHMTSTQNPDGLNTVTPYTITLDRDDNWLITDVAGIAGAAQDGSTGTGTPDLAPSDSAASNPSQAAPSPAAPNP